MELSASTQPQPEEKEEIMNLTKTVPISHQEEMKLASFLSKLKFNIEGDEELTAMLGGTLNQWSN